MVDGPTTGRGVRLYRETHDTFEAYCKERWGMTKIHAYRLIGAAEVTEGISKSNQLVTPKSESVVRPLTVLPPEKQAAAWQEAVETAPEGKVSRASSSASSPVRRLLPLRVSGP